MPDQEINDYLKYLTTSSELAMVEDDEMDDELKEAIGAMGIKLPNPDLAPFRCMYAPTDEANLNGAILDDTEITDDVLNTIKGKPVNIDHITRNVVGFWAGLKRDKENSKLLNGCGVIFKNAFKSEYAAFKDLVSKKQLAVSMEVYSYNKVPLSNGKRLLKGLEFAGGAVLMKTKPAFPGMGVKEMASTLEIASIEDVKTFVIDKPVNNDKDLRLIASVLNVSKEVFKMKELMASLKESASEAQVKVLEQVELKYGEVELALAKKSEEFDAKVAELAAKAEEIALAGITVESLNAKVAELVAEIATVKASMAAEIEKAKLEAIKLAAIKSELGEFAADMSDADLMSEDKVEIARLKQQLAVEKAAKVVSVDAKPELVVASKVETVKTDKALEAQARIRKELYGV